MSKIYGSDFMEPAHWRANPGGQKHNTLQGKTTIYKRQLDKVVLKRTKMTQFQKLTLENLHTELLCYVLPFRVTRINTH